MATSNAIQIYTSLTDVAGAADAWPGRCDRDRPALSPVASLARRQPAPERQGHAVRANGGSAGFMGQKWDGGDIAGSAAAHRTGTDRSTSRTPPQHRPAPGSATRALP